MKDGCEGNRLRRKQRRKAVAAYQNKERQRKKTQRHEKNEAQKLKRQAKSAKKAGVEVSSCVLAVHRFHSEPHKSGLLNAKM